MLGGGGGSSRPGTAPHTDPTGIAPFSGVRPDCARTDCQTTLHLQWRPDRLPAGQTARLPYTYSGVRTDCQTALHLQRRPDRLPAGQTSPGQTARLPYTYSGVPTDCQPVAAAEPARFQTEHGRDDTAALSETRPLFVLLGELASGRNGFPTAAAIDG